MTNEPWDTIIIGQGIAGTTLAWHLVEAGQRVLLVDAEASVTASKIAAGLITPITGLRLTLSEQVGTFLPVARDFYIRIEARTGQHFFHPRTAVRLFQTDDERRTFAQRSAQLEFQEHLASPQPNPLLDPHLADVSGKGFAMHAAQLDVAAYLAASRAHLAYTAMSIDWRQDVTFDADTVTVQGHRTRLLISCEGYAATRNPYFSDVQFQAAKGDILTVRFDQPLPPHCLHRGIWLAPTADAHIFRAGSTYDLVTLDTVPSVSARTEIESKLRAFVRIPFTVLDHQAAVRPIIRQSQALIGLHPTQPRLGFFNGLGSKGALNAPWYAQRLTEFLVHGTPIPDASNVRTHLAHAARH